MKKLYSEFGLIYPYGHEELAICEDIYIGSLLTLVSMDGAYWRRLLFSYKRSWLSELLCVKSLLLHVRSFPVTEIGEKIQAHTRRISLPYHKENLSKTFMNFKFR